jgi:hypothetical protein
VAPGGLKLPSKGPVVVLGLDGLDPSMTSEFTSLRGGHLFKADPLIPLTYPSWSSIFTGVNPGKHGLLDFFKFERLSSGKWRARVVSSLDLEYPRVPEIIRLSPRRGHIRFAIINPIPSVPLPLIDRNDGLIISLDFFTPRPISNDISAAMRYYDIETYTELQSIIRLSSNCNKIEKAYNRLIKIHREALVELFNNYDLVWVNLPLPDNYLHLCSQDLIENNTRFHRLLKALDDLVNVIRKYSDNFIIISDHGFGVYKGIAHVNAILYKHGLAFPAKRTEDSVVDLSGSLGGRPKEVKANPAVVNLALKVFRGPMRPVARASYHILRQIFHIFGRDLTYTRISRVDIRRSKAFVPTWSNVDAPRYLVLLNDPSIASTVASLLRKYELTAYIPSELLWGPYVLRDSVIVYGRRFHPSPGSIYHEMLVEKPIAQHRRYGVFYAELSDESVLLPGGSNDSSEREVVPNYIVAPLVLCLLDVPLDKYMDGLNLLDPSCSTNTISYAGRWRLLKRIRSTPLSGAFKSG